MPTDGLPESHPLFMAGQMLTFLFQKAPPDHWIEFRAIWNKDSGKPAPQRGLEALPEACMVKEFHRSFALSISDWVLRLNRRGYDIFFGVCPRFDMPRGGGGAIRSAKDVNVSHAVCAWMDHDNPAWRKIVEAEKIQATFIVSTGHGAHLYLCYPEAIPSSRAVEHVKALIHRYGSDVSAFNPSKLLRLPGTRNWKEPDKNLICEIYRTDLDYVFKDFPEGPAQPPTGSVMSLPMDLRNVVLHGYSAATGRFAPGSADRDQSRSAVDFKIAVNLFSLGWTREDVERVFTNPEYGVSEKNLERPENVSYLRTTLDKALIAAEKHRLRFPDIGEMLVLKTEEDLDKAKPPVFVIDYLLPKYGLLMMSGPAKAGKSLLATDLVLLLAGANGLFMDRFGIHEPGPVLFVQDEIPESFLKDRFRRISASRKNDWRKLPHKLRFYNGSFDLSDLRHVSALEKSLEKMEAEYLVIDPLADYHSLNENRQGDMIQIFSTIERISRYAGLRGTVIIHHHGKPTDDREDIHRPRGSSVISAKGDGHLIIRGMVSKATGTDYISVGFKLRAAKALPQLSLAIDEESLRFQTFNEDMDRVHMTLAVLEEVHGEKDMAVDRLRSSGLSKAEAERTVVRALMEKSGDNGKNGNGQDAH